MIYGKPRDAKLKRKYTLTKFFGVCLMGVVS